MANPKERPWVTPCSGGVNQAAELARIDECADARNVWAPNGRVEQRPGYVGTAAIRFGSTTVTVFKARAEDVSAGTFSSPNGAGVLDLSNLQALAAGVDADRVYLGHTATFGSVAVSVSASNSNNTGYSAEYWNGTAWMPVAVSGTAVNVVGGGSVGTLGAPYFSSDAGLPMVFAFAPPQDWVLTTVDGQSAYWLRFNLRYQDFDAATSIDVDNGTTGIRANSALVGLRYVQFVGITRTLTLGRDTSTAIAYSTNNVRGPGVVYSTSRAAGLPGSFADEPPTYAIIPDFGEAFVAYNNFVARHTRDGVSATGLSTPAAEVETRAALIGPGAPYNAALIPLETQFPQAKYISFFDGRLWAAGLANQPYHIRWSAPYAPYGAHKVWPSIQYEVLMEQDNSPITGMHPLGENMIVFKNDSIWTMVDLGQDDLGLRRYVPKQADTAGIGCVANSSIQEVRGELVFLSEDGLYAFNGKTVRKVTLDRRTQADRLADTFASITKPRRPFVSSVNWTSRNVYLLSMTTDGSEENNLTVVWDYQRDAFWLWDNIDAQTWALDESSSDEQLLYFGDKDGGIYLFDSGRTDHGGTINSYVVTQRLGLNDGVRRRVLREIEVLASNKTRQLTLQPMRNDAEVSSAYGHTAVIDFTDVSEHDWTDFSYASGATTDDNWVAARRRRAVIKWNKEVDWLQLKVSHTTKDQGWELSQLALRWYPLKAG